MSDDVQMMQRRGTLGVLMLVVPVVSILAVGMAYAVLVWFGVQGREATGPLVTLSYGACDEARPLLEARVGEMGLPDPVWTDTEAGFDLTVRLPDAERVATRIPVALTRPGRLEVRSGDDGDVVVTEADLADVTVVMAFLDVPYAQVMLTPQGTERLVAAVKGDVEGHLSIWVDGELVSRRRNVTTEIDGRIPIDPAGRTELERVDFAAETAMLLGHGPLPCEVALLGQRRLDP